MNRIRYLLIACLVIFGPSCGYARTIELTAEQGVYETLFTKIVGNTYSKYYIAGATENEWFTNNPIKAASWEASLDSLGNIPMDLVIELYRVNEISHPLNWKPLVTNAVLLPASYAKNAEPKERDSRCLVHEGEGNIGIGSKTGKGAYRSYYSVSKVAFSSDNKLALVKFSYLCAPLSGAGESFAAFELREKQWHLIGVKRLWVS